MQVPKLGVVHLLGALDYTEGFSSSDSKPRSTVSTTKLQLLQLFQDALYQHTGAS
jgi:hypothetical protein